MIPHRSEAIVLHTWPFRESDLTVSLLTRDMGKLRGIARAALKSRKRFGGALEPMTIVRASFAVRPSQDLVRLEQFETIASPLAEPVDYLRAATLAFYAELIESVLPDNDPQDAVFRLAQAVLPYSRFGACWMPLTYFSLWLTRLIGWLPEMDRCVECGSSLTSGGGYYHALSDGLRCSLHQRPSGRRLDPDTVTLALRMLREPIGSFAAEAWGRERGRDLRRFLVRTLERHIERRLNSAAALAQMGG
jgi:DNA repair protein RecO (recombination protein O)